MRPVSDGVGILKETRGPMIDVNDLRRPASLLHGLVRADEAYTLYYDETNNIRRLLLAGEGLNVPELKCFVLGGIGHAGSDRPIDLAPLRRSARIQPNAPELKFEYFGKGDFPAVLASPRITAFLEWVAEQGFLAHYLTLDPFYWSTVDIIDSVLTDADAVQLHAIAPQLKSDLYGVLRSDLVRTTALLSRYNFPDVGRERRADFLKEIRRCLEDESESLDDFSYQMLKGVLQIGERGASLPFLEDEEPVVLIDTFADFFLERLSILKHADHVLDTEEVIIKRVAALDLRDGDLPFRNYRFIERSHDEPGVQASDVMVGLLGKFFSWIVETDLETVGRARAELSPIQARNAQMLAALLDRSTDENAALANTIISLVDQEKAFVFLQS